MYATIRSFHWIYLCRFLGDILYLYLVINYTYYILIFMMNWRLFPNVVHAYIFLYATEPDKSYRTSKDVKYSAAPSSNPTQYPVKIINLDVKVEGISSPLNVSICKCVYIYTIEYKYVWKYVYIKLQSYEYVYLRNIKISVYLYACMNNFN